MHVVTGHHSLGFAMGRERGRGRQGSACRRSEPAV